MLLFLLLSLFRVSNTQHCAPGSIQLPQDMKCALIKLSGDESGYFEADTVCQDLGGHLISIHNAFANSILVAYATGAKLTDSLYIGGDKHRNNMWTWIDKSNMNYTNWAPGQPSGTGACITMKLSDGKWYASNCQQKLPYFCAVPEITGPACPEGWAMYENNCYQLNVLSRPIRWKNAQQACTMVGANLASIHSGEENSFLSNVLCANLPSNASAFPFIGLYWNKRYFWADQSNVTYLNVFEQPTDYTIYQLATIDYGIWNDLIGDPPAYSYICKQPLIVINGTSTGNQKLSIEGSEEKHELRRAKYSGGF